MVNTFSTDTPKLSNIVRYNSGLPLHAVQMEFMQDFTGTYIGILTEKTLIFQISSDIPLLKRGVFLG